MAVTITRTANPNGVSASSNVATYTNVAIGDADASRIVVVCVSSEVTGGTINSCTLGGNAMTAGTAGTQGVVNARTFYLAVPTGTTATIAVTFGANNTSTQNHISVYSVTGGVYASTGGHQSTDMDGGTALTTGSQTIATGGGMIAVLSAAVDTQEKTWSIAGQDLDVDAGVHRHSTWFSTTPATQTLSVTGGTNGEDGAISWLIFTANVSPTIALGTNVVDEATITDTTPTFQFTGTDTESDDIRYNIQIDTVDTFASGIDHTSNVDTTAFTRSGDSDPFTSGQQVEYTVPVADALTPDTYYWRVRGLDPSGSNAYGAWSTTRSFDITAGTTANSDRGLYIAGKIASSSDRGLYIKGKTTESSDRLLYATGRILASSDRNLYTQGQSTGNSERGLYITGSLNAYSERLLHIAGKATASSDRGLYMAGISTSSSDRNLYTQGSLTSSSDRGLYTSGVATSSSDRGLYISGYVIGNEYSERLLHIAGVSTSSSDRNLYTQGSIDGSSDRGVYLEGKATSSSDRGLYINGYSEETTTRQFLGFMGVGT